jgi:uncharacterized protein YhaN
MDSTQSDAREEGLTGSHSHWRAGMITICQSWEQQMKEVAISAPLSLPHCLQSLDIWRHGETEERHHRSLGKSIVPRVESTEHLTE